MSNSKRKRENDCPTCGQNHDVYEDGNVLGCGQRASQADRGMVLEQRAFSTEILHSFLYLGNYYNASMAGILKAQGVTRILNTATACQDLYPEQFNYYNLSDDNTLPFNECIQYLEQGRMEQKGVLVHCMSGLSRSPAVVIAYLMRIRRWSLTQSYQWVKKLRPSISLTSAVTQQLQDYEAEVFGNSATSADMMQNLPTGGHPTPAVPIKSPMGGPSDPEQVSQTDRTSQ